MQLGMIGLGRMGGNMTTRLARGRARREDVRPRRRARPPASLDELRDQLDAPRAFWMMVPAGRDHRGDVPGAARRSPSAGDTIVDGGNSNFRDSQRRYARRREKGIHFVDAGVSGGIWGLEVGYCLMVGGDDEAVDAARADLPRARARGRLRARRRAPARATSRRWSTTGSSTA